MVSGEYDFIDEYTSKHIQKNVRQERLICLLKHLTK